MNVKYAICVLETIGSGAALSNINDKESACIMAIKALDTLEKIKDIVQEEECYEASNSIDNPRPNQADYDAVHADKFNRIWKVISDAERVDKQTKPADTCEWTKYDYRTIVPKYHDADNPYWRIPENMDKFKYCPYCGKEIVIS